MIELSTVLGDIAKSIVDHPDKVVVTEHTEGDEVILTLSVAEEDMGRVIGKQGRIAKAIRTAKIHVLVISIAFSIAIPLSFVVFET